MTPEEMMQEISVKYRVSIPDLEKSRLNCARFMRASSTKSGVIDLLCKEYGISREGAMCAIACGKLMAE